MDYKIILAIIIAVLIVFSVLKKLKKLVIVSLIAAAVLAGLFIYTKPYAYAFDTISKTIVVSSGKEKEVKGLFDDDSLIVKRMFSDSSVATISSYKYIIQVFSKAGIRELWLGDDFGYLTTSDGKIYKVVNHQELISKIK